MARAEQRCSRVRAGALGVLSALLAGCALHIQPVSLAPHLPGAIPEGVSPDRPRLGVGPFVDVRSIDSRRGLVPPLRASFLGVIREGENQTGDRAFVGDLAEQVRRDAAATLAHSGAFSEVLLLNPGSNARQADVDYVLSGRIEELTGIQYQRAQLSLLQVGFLRNRYFEAVGIARIQYALKRADAVVWSERIESNARGADLAIAQAAVDAAALANERMAETLFGRLGRGFALRTLPVRVLDACGLGRGPTELLIRDAGEVLERELGVRLAPAVEAWDEPGGLKTSLAVLDAVQRLAPPKGGIVAAFAPLPRDRSIELGARRFGIARQLGQHAVVDCRADDEPAALTLAHEIGHLFGAVHVRERSSLMHPVASFPGRFLDPLNRRVMRLTRERSFDRPLDRPLAEQIRAVYRAANDLPDEVNAPDLVEALSALPAEVSPKPSR